MRLLFGMYRDIYVQVFNNKLIYNIPLYSDKLFQNTKIEIVNNTIKLTFFKPVVSLLK